MVSISFFVIAGLILIGLVKDRSLGVNPLGVATALVFLTCASGHAMHAERYFMEAAFFSNSPDLWPMLLVDSFTVAAGLGYLAQRRRYGLVIRGAHPLMDYQRRLEMSEALRDISHDIAAQTDFDELLHRVVHHARNLLGGDYVALMTVDESGKAYLRSTGTRTGGWDQAAWNKAVYLSELARASAEKSPRYFLMVDDVRSARTGQWDSLLHRNEGGRSVLAVAIRRGDRVSGSLMVAWRRRRPPAQDDIASASALAGQAAIAIEKAWLIDSLRRSDRMKDEFIAAAAHELKTPVTTIKGWAEVLLRPGSQGAMAGPRERKGLEAIRSQAERMTRLSDDLLAVMDLRPGFENIDRQRCDLSELAQQAVERAQRWDERRDLRLELSGPLIVEGDRGLILEMLGRLLENAVRYSPAGKAIEVKTSQNGGEAVVSVTDHGAGIPADRQAHVFEPFYEPIPPGEEGYVGIVSLGLGVSRQIVEAHGGRIWVTSNPGEGSTFSVGLPLA